MKSKKQLSPSEIASFCSQTAMILKAGISAAEGMNILLEDTSNSEGKEIIEQIRDICYEGESFYTALERSDLFPKYVLDMVNLGEQSGNLDVTMQSLADYYERQEAISDSIKNAVSYPLIMIAMMVLVILVLITQVLPIFGQVFNQLGTEMNAFSLSLMKAGNVLSNSTYVIIALLAIIILVAFYFSKTESGKKHIRNILTRFPLTAKFYESINCSRFASGMALTLSSGMDTFESLNLVAELVDDAKMKEKIETCKQMLMDGESFPDALSSVGIFSSLNARMISVGFKTGSMETVMAKIADNYEQEINQRIRSIIAVLEPSLVIILSLIVGLILLSVILPLMGIMSSIG